MTYHTEAPREDKGSSLVGSIFCLVMPGVSTAGGTPQDPSLWGRPAKSLGQVGMASPGFTTPTSHWPPQTKFLKVLAILRFTSGAGHISPKVSHTEVFLWAMCSSPSATGGERRHLQSTGILRWCLNWEADTMTPLTFLELITNLKLHLGDRCRLAAWGFILCCVWGVKGRISQSNPGLPNPPLQISHLHVPKAKQEFVNENFFK